MRKLTFVLILVALLVVSTAVVYAGFVWDGDPPIGNGVSLAWMVIAARPAEGWTPDVHYEARVVEGHHHDEGGVEATVWTARYEGEGACTLRVELTRDQHHHHHRVLATKSGPCGSKVKVEWKSD
jgi:hypothetical protein